MTCIETVAIAILALKPEWDGDRVKMFAEPICVESQARAIDPLLTVAVIHNESNWKVRAVGHNANGSVDIGLMQFNCTDQSKINMSWRKWWCSRRRYLKTIRGGIRAGVRILAFSRDSCLRRHRKDFRRLNPTYPDCIFHSDCSEASTTEATTRLSNLTERTALLKRTLSEHWWVQHYNWYGKGYSRRILYIYLVLKLRLRGNYPILQQRLYGRYSSGRCLMMWDMCLGEHRKWQRRQNLRKRRRSSKRKFRL